MQFHFQWEPVQKLKKSKTQYQTFAFCVFSNWNENAKRKKVRLNTKFCVLHFNSFKWPDLQLYTFSENQCKSWKNAKRKIKLLRFAFFSNWNENAKRKKVRLNAKFCVLRFYSFKWPWPFPRSWQVKVQSSLIFMSSAKNTSHQETTSSWVRDRWTGFPALFLPLVRLVSTWWFVMPYFSYEEGHF